jgi:hypothetical protein
MLADELQRAFGARGSGSAAPTGTEAVPGGGSALPEFRLVGHSLGSQLAIAATHLLLERSQQSAPGAGSAAAAAAAALPSRIAMLDPHISPGKKKFHAGQTCGDVICKMVRELKDSSQGSRGIVFEQVQTSIIADLPGMCDVGGLSELAAFVRLDPPSIGWWDVAGAHCCAPALYMLSMELTPNSGTSGSTAGRGVFEVAPAGDDGATVQATCACCRSTTLLPFDALAGASDDRIRELSEAPYGLIQVRGGFFKRAAMKKHKSSAGGGSDTLPQQVAAPYSLDEAEAGCAGQA